MQLQQNRFLSSDITSKQDTVMPLTSSEIDGILESWKKDSFNVLRAKINARRNIW